ncbi:MAG: DUF488 family protein [Acidobacteriota bacterium]
MEIFTYGHSVRDPAELDVVLGERRFGFVADIRRFPGEKKNPGFGTESVQGRCLAHGTTYVALGRQLGGGRSEGYREYMGTSAFAEGIEELSSLARRQPTLILGRAAWYFRCVRKYLADELLRQGFVVSHLLDDSRAFRHRLGCYRIAAAPDTCE